jgi:trans-aconitate 2-methyltransferase
MTTSTRDWDAASYQRVSVPHEEWARAILARLGLRGGERVLDAGCGSGRVTSILLGELPQGQVVAVDGSPSMVAKVEEVLRPQDEALVSDLTALELERPVDAIFSSAVFHWIADHELLFRRLRATLKPGGRFAAQCGGAGNIADFRERTAEIAARDPYAAFLRDFEEPWNYADVAESEARLEAAGFEDVRCWLQPWEILPPEPAEFLRTVCLGPYIDQLPDELGDRFVAEILAVEPSPLRMGYVRLNIEAVAGEGQ